MRLQCVLEICDYGSSGDDSGEGAVAISAATVASVAARGHSRRQGATAVAIVAAVVAAAAAHR